MTNVDKIMGTVLNKNMKTLKNQIILDEASTVPVIRKGVNQCDVNTFGSVEVTPQGFLKAPVTVTRTGILDYRRPDGSLFRQLRLPEEVFDEESMKTLEHAPVTFRHPEEGFVTPDNARALMVGFLDRVNKDGDSFLGSQMVITDGSVIKRVKAGVREVSPGYVCDLEMTPGELNGQHFDAIQRNIRYNHLAIVERGRSGPKVRIKLNQFDSVECGIETEDEQTEGGSAMLKKITLKDGTVVEVDEKVAAHFDEVATEVTKKEKDEEELKRKEAETKANMDRIQADADAAKADVARLTTDMAALKLKLDAASKPPTLDSMKEHVQARVQVLAVAHQVLADDAKKTLDTMDNVAIMSAVVKADDPSISLDGKSEDYIRGRFEHITTAVKDRMDEAAALGTLIIKTKTEDVETEDACGETEHRRKLLDAWKNPVGVAKDHFKG